MNLKSQRSAMLLGLAAVFLWSTAATAFRISLTYLQPVQLVLLASFISVLVTGSWIIISGQSWQVLPALKQKPFYYLLMGQLNPFLYYIVLFKAYDLLPAQQAQALNYTWALTLTLLAVPLLHQKLRRKDWLSCCLGYTGALIIATDGHLLALNFQNPAGVILALSSTLIWALYWIFNTKNTDPPAVSLLLCFMSGLPGILITNLITGSMHFPWQGILGAVYVGFFEMGITFILWLSALKKATHIAGISNLIFISPFLSLVFIAVVLKEPITATTITGLIVIISAVIIQQKQ